LENPGTDGNQSDTPLVENDEQPASAKTISAAAPAAPTLRSTTGPVPIELA
jgi:hypothetical protein